MSDQPERVRLLEMIAAAEDIVAWTHGVPEAAFVGDARLRSAVGMQLIVIGEGARELPEAIKSRASHVAWRDIVDLRYRLAHAYSRASPRVVWLTAIERAPELLQDLRRLLESLGPEPD